MKVTILHVDDDESNRYVVKKIVEKAGYEYREAATGKEGIELATKIHPDLIVLDIKLPDITGFEVCRLLKQSPATRSIPVLQTSASFVTTENKVAGLESGADGYLAQPIDDDVLVATVKSLLRIREAEKRANEAIRAREELLAIVSHDLRNPLSFIMMQSKVMERGLKENLTSEEEIINKLRRINNSCLKMNRMIQDILDVTSIEQGKLILHKTEFVAGSLFDDILEYYGEVALQSEITLLIERNNLEKITINADREKLQQVFSNLVSNALKFTQSGGEIHLRMSKSENNIVFEVQDSGSGIPQSHLPHVFNRYWQGHPERKSGYGIGLSIVKGVVDAHGGSVKIESQEGKGTKVTITLPIH